MMKFIHKVERAPISALTHEPLPLPDGQCVWWDIVPTFEVLPIVGLAELRTKSEVEGGVRIVHTMLNATLRCDINTIDEPALYRLTDTAGQTFLLGMHTPPYPITVTESNVDAKLSGQAATTLRIDWHHIYSPLEIL